MFKPGIENDLDLEWPSNMIFGSKGQRLRSQGHKVQKHIEGARVAGVSYALYRLLASSWVMQFIATDQFQATETLSRRIIFLHIKFRTFISITKFVKMREFFPKRILQYNTLGEEIVNSE